MKVLIAEDSLSVRKLLASTLESAGHQVLEANDGQEAVDVVKSSESIDFVVMDAEMPVMDGFEATRLIRELRRRTGFRSFSFLVMKKITIFKKHSPPVPTSI